MASLVMAPAPGGMSDDKCRHGESLKVAMSGRALLRGSSLLTRGRRNFLRYIRAIR